MSRFWRHFITNGNASYVGRRLGLDGDRAVVTRRQGKPSAGLRVWEVRPGGPAEEGGVLEGDLLLTLAGERVGGLAGLRRRLRGLPEGLPVAMTLLRRGRLLERWVVPGGRAGSARWQ